MSYYDFDGNPITLDEWARATETKRAARQRVPEGETTPEEDPSRIGSDTVDGKWVSTVWLGIDYQFGDGPPLIFETMVFPQDGSFDEEFCDRYSTRAEAEEGHRRVVAALREGRTP